MGNSIQAPSPDVVARRWQADSFYKDAVVLGLDIGIEGIGVWLRKGSDCLFRRTFIIKLPSAAPLKERRMMRAARNARRSRRQRDRLLRAWIVRHGLLPEERVKAIWQDAKVFERAYEHRLRAITNGKSLASPEALVVCIRHIVRHRGYDYHLLFRDSDAAYPWGDVIKIGLIKKWAGQGVLPSDYGAELKSRLQTAFEDGEMNENDLVEAEKLLDQAIERYAQDPIRELLERHLREKNHTNLREPARGANFPRELIKAHLREVCAHNQKFFTSGHFESAMLELIGRSEKGVDIYDEKNESILDYHRRTPEEARKLWERKEGDCDLASILVKEGLLPPGSYKRSAQGDADIRRWKLLVFLVERNVELATRERRTANEKIIRDALHFLNEDARALSEKKLRPKLPTFTQLFGKEMGKLMPMKHSDLNRMFKKHLDDLLRPTASKMKAKAGLSSATAAALFRRATQDGSVLDPARIRVNLADYYQWRRSIKSGAAMYPQVEFLLGNRGHFEASGQSKDGPRRKDGRTQQHGILRRLFADQLKMDTGETIHIRSKLNERTTPDFVVIEVVGDAPRNESQRREIRDEQKRSRDAKEEILRKYGYTAHDLDLNQIRRVLLFDQQAGPDGVAICPYTGHALGSDPLARHLEVEHVFPEKRGGLTVMENLVLTARKTNDEKGDRTPVEWLGVEKASTFLARMQWNSRKKALFLRIESECPDWQNMTRTAQLSRQLKDEVVNWLGIERQFDHVRDEAERSKAVANEIYKRVGAPNGAMTAACRESWRESLPENYFVEKQVDGRTFFVKNRSNLRHHMWDAGVLAQIPPGKGINSHYYGGIFDSFRTRSGVPVLRALPQLAPQMAQIETGDPVGCYVCEMKQRNSKKSRTKQQPVSMPDTEGKMWQRVALSKTVNKDGIVETTEPENLPEKLGIAGLLPRHVTLKAVESWMNDPRPIDQHPLRLNDGTPVHTLRLPLKQLPAEVARLPHVKTTPNPKTSGSSALPYPSGRVRPYGYLIGFKGATECYDRCEIWSGHVMDKQGRPRLDKAGRPQVKYHSVLVPTARNLAIYRRVHGRPYKANGIEGMTTRIRSIRKGDLLLAEFGPVTDDRLELCGTNCHPVAKVWLRVESIKSRGALQLKPAEFRSFASASFALQNVKSDTWEPKSPEVLARLSSSTAKALSRDS